MLAAWLVSPILTSVHLECFTQRLQSLAAMDLQGLLPIDDFNYPVFTEYLYATRVGLVHLLEWVMRITGTSANYNFRILLIASLLSVFVSSVVFVRRWSDEPRWAVVAALFLAPGVIEASFYFADNLPSAALAIAGMALIGPRTPTWRYAAAGSLFAAAVLTRLDAVYTVPMFLALYFAGRRFDWRHLAVSMVAFAAGACVVWLISWRFTGVSLIASLQVGAMWAGMHMANVRLRYDTAHVAVGFFGLVMPPLLVLGAIANRRRGLQWNLVMTLVPALFYLYVVPKVLETRVLLLLGVPFIALHGATGVRIVLSALQDARRSRRIAARAAVAVVVLSFVVPPFMFERDGPRTFLGRAWSPLLWQDWQAREESGEARVTALIDGLKPNEPAFVMSSTWQADSVFHLMLLQRGWRKSPPPPATADFCARTAEVYTDGDRRLVQYRLEDPYDLARASPLRLDRNYVQAFEMVLAIRCIESQSFKSGYLVDWDAVPHMLDQVRVATGSEQPAMDLFPSHFPVPVHRPRMLRRLRLIPLLPDELPGMQADAAAVMKKVMARDGNAPLTSDQPLREAYRARFWQPETRR